MNTLSRTARLISAVAAVAITLTLLDAVFAIAEPQRSVLIAKLAAGRPAGRDDRRRGAGGARRRQDHQVRRDLPAASGRRLQRMHRHRGRAARQHGRRRRLGRHAAGDGGAGRAVDQHRAGGAAGQGFEPGRALDRRADADIGGALRRAGVAGDDLAAGDADPQTRPAPCRSPPVRR